VCCGIIRRDFVLSLGDDEKKNPETASGLSMMPSCAVHISNRTKCLTCGLLPVG
jgi:hypothetical protein